MKDDKSPTGFIMVDLEVLEPISLLKYLWDNVGVKVSPEDVKHFWRWHKQHGAEWATHTTANETHIPLGLYGDAAKVRQTVTGQIKQVGIFVNCPLWRARSIRASRWLLFSIRESLLYKHHTLNAIFRHLTKSFNTLFDGVYGASGRYADKAGSNIISTGLKFAVCELRGDWLWHRQVWRFKSSWKGGAKVSVCFCCEGAVSHCDRNPNMIYYNVLENSPVWTTQHSHTDFIAKELPARDPCPLLLLRGFHYTMIRFCSMHTVNLGLCYTINGSALLLISNSGMGWLSVLIVL